MKIALPLFFCSLYSVCSAQDLQSEWKKGLTALEKEDFKSANSHFDTIIAQSEKLDAPDAGAFYNRGLALAGQKQWARAIGDFSRAIVLDPKDADSFAERAMARKATGDYDGLVNDASEAARLDSRYSALLEGAQSNRLFNRALLGFGILGIIVLCLGIIPFARGLIRISRASG